MVFPFSHLHRRRGFTLVEMLIVLLILAILLAIAIPAYLALQSNAKDQKANQYLDYAYRSIRAEATSNSGNYPQSTSMVNWVQQDQPELTVQSGSCSTLWSLTPLTVVVDTGSTASNLTLCTKSESGDYLKLASTNTGAPSFLSGNAVPLSFSGNEITDTTRAAKTQGDGLTSDSSTGVWPASTNLLPNGGYESNTNNWSASSASTTSITSDNSTSQFGSKSLKVVVTAASGVRNNGTAVTAGQPYTFSTWVKGTTGNQMVIQIVRADFATVVAQTTFTATGSWQRVSASTGSAPATETNYVFIKTTGAGADNFWVDGAQLEQLFTPTPYIETNGSTASRGNANVTAPAALLSATQGWVAARIRLGWAASSPPRGGSQWDWWFKWGAGSGASRNSIDALYRESGSLFDVENYVSGTSVTADSAAQSFSSNTTHTLIIYWTATTIGESVDGGNFVTIARSTGVQTAANMPSTFSIGSSYGGSQINGSVLWFATGSGTLSNSDSSSIFGFGDSDPSTSNFSSSAASNFVWDGTSTSGSLK